MAGKSVGHLAPRVDDTVPGNITCGVEVLEYLADKAGSPWQAGHGGDLAIGGNPALGNTADYSVDRRRGFVALGWGHLEQPAPQWHRQFFRSQWSSLHVGWPDTRLDVIQESFSIPPGYGPRSADEIRNCRIGPGIEQGLSHPPRSFSEWHRLRR